LGFFKDSTANQAGHLPFDAKRQMWSDWRDIKHYVFPIQPDKFVDLVPPGTLMGRICPQAQQDTGLNPDVQIIAGASDKACETLGVGCFDDTEGVLSFGSQASVQTMSNQYYELQQFVPAFPAAMPGCWNPELQVYRGYWMVNWFLREMENASVQEQERPEETFDTYLAKTKPGNDGLVMYPYMGASAKYPRSSGTIMGLKDYHGKAHLYRAMLEGINYTLRWAIDRMEQKKKSPILRMKVTGGGATSDMICQMTADMFGRETIRMETTDTTSLGAAIIGYVAIGVHRDYKTAAAQMTRPGKVFKPNPINVEIYNEFYKAYLQDLEKRIHFNEQRG
jgi:sugar (pentulose or hexulose) kinase